MARSLVRRNVVIEILQDDDTLPTENQKIVRVHKCRGNNLHEVETTDGTILLASMPKRFRAGVWLRKGNFLLVEPIEEGNKVKAEIVRILSADQVKYYKMSNVWPKEFSDDSKDKKRSMDSDEDLFVNPNRPRVCDVESSDSDSNSDSDEDDVESDSSDESQDDSSKK